MQRFHFNAVMGDKIVADPEGEMLPNTQAALDEATALAREMLSNSIRSGQQPPDFIQVTNDNGEAILKVALADLLPRFVR